MSRSEIHTTVRIVDEKADYIIDKWEGSISKYLNYSIPRDIDIINKNKKKSFFQDFSQRLVMLGIGCLFILFSLKIDDVLSFLIIMFLGLFFVTTSLVSISLEVRKTWKTL